MDRCCSCVICRNRTAAEIGCCRGSGEIGRGEYGEEPMSKRPELQPAWLVGLLNRWAVRSLKAADKGLGYYSECPMLKSGIPGRVRSYEPTGYSADDFLQVDAAVGNLPLMRRLAVFRYFKPWSRNAIDMEIRKDNDTWMYHLREALKEIDAAMNQRASIAHCESFRL